MKTMLLQGLTLLILLNLIPGFSSKSTAQNPCKEVIGYYPGWQWYDRNKLVNPASIDYSKYTIINYAFLYPLPDGSIQITDPWGDKNLLLGSINWAVAPAGYDSNYDLGNPAYHNPNTSLIHHAQLGGVEVMISIGGWTLSNDFPAIAADPAKRSNFAHWCNKLIHLYGINGIDIDWEYPGYAAHNGTPSDKVNYTLLLQEVRDSLDAIDPNLKLTAAFGAAPDRMDDIEWNQMVNILDYINLMSYDFFGAFSPNSNHNSPLYTPASGDTTFNCNSAIERLINDHNVPPSKINLGVAFYGRSSKTTGTPGLHVPNNGSTDMATFSMDDGSPQYYNVMDQMNLFDYNWDSNAEVPYLTGKNGLNTFVSYDDERSIGLKGQYVVDQGLGGVIIWEITGDYMETSPNSGVIAGTPLADTLNLALCHAPSSGGGGGTDTTGGGGGGIGVDEYSTSNFELYPNPNNGQFTLEMSDYSGQNYTVSILDIRGKEIDRFAGNSSKLHIDMRSIESGLYMVRLQMEGRRYTSKFMIR